MKRILKWLLIIFIILFLIIVYARYVGTMGLVTKEYTIKSKDIPDGFDGIKIVHFSDIHYNRAISKKKIESIINEINLIKPDIVVFTGDLIDKDVKLTDKDYNDLTNLLLKIKARYGKYAILGNHDYVNEMDKVISVYEGSNFKYLDNDYDILYDKNNEKIFIGGINTVSYDMDDVSKTMSYFKDNEDIPYKIILVHEPDISDKIVKDYSVNLILSGHSHGGQIRLPIIGPIYTPPYRLWNRPSINFYRINKEASNN